MWNGTAPRFDDVRQRERELNDRQRKVLDLIERGHTNREIADMLGITLDGAKWNVSEILGKLGLDSREDAAEYWRWRKQRTPAIVRALRGGFALPSLKWVVGGSGALLVGGMVLFSVVGGGTSGQADEPPDSFYIEATAHRADPEHPTDHEFRWWHYDENHAKWNWDLVAPAIRTRHETSVQDGTTLYTYSPDGGTVSTETGWSNGVRFPRPTDVILIGPTEQRSITELLDYLSRWGDGQTPAKVTGNENVAGWDTVVIDYVSGRMWVNPSNMLIVKHESDSVTMTMTGWSARHLDASEVRLPASVAARPTPTAATPGRLPVHFPIPLLAPTYQPWASDDMPGFGFSCDEPGDCLSEQILMSDEQFWANQHTPGTPARSGTYVAIEQRTGLAAMPEPMTRRTEIQIRGATGYLTETSASLTLNWREPDGRIVEIEAVGVPTPEVLKVAEGLQLRP